MSLSGSFSGGGPDLGRFLEVIASDQKFSEKMKELLAAENAAKAIVELVGPAESIPVLHEKAKVALAEAEANLVASREEAQKIVDAAKIEAADVNKATEDLKASVAAEAEAILKKASTDAEKLRGDAAAVLKSAVEERSRVSAEEAILLGRMKDVEVREAGCASREAEAAAVKARYEDRFNRTRDIWLGPGNV